MKTTYLDTDFVMDTWRPSFGSWHSVIRQLKEDGQLLTISHEFVNEVLRNGEMEPVVLGGDGLVQANSLSVIASYMQGYRKVRVAFAFIPARELAIPGLAS